MKHQFKAFAAQFKAVDEAKGIFEAIVAVFGNVDRGGDVILPGAFAGTLEAWQQKGRPIPVVFAHQWDNLDAHIGQVLEADERDEGLYVKAQLEMDEPFAARVWKKMKAGTLAEFSFAYDVLESAQVDRGADTSPRYVNELRELELFEVGPCLVGMNPDTQLLGVKEGRRNSTSDLGRIQKIHDLTVELGAKCAEPDDTGDEGEGSSQDKTGNGRTRSSGTSTFAARVALELIENN